MRMLVCMIALSNNAAKKQAHWIHVGLVSVALPGMCRLRMRARWGGER